MKNLLKKWNESSLVLRILGGLIIGVVLGLAVPQAAPIGLLGDLFVGALKAVAPLLVLFLVMTALSRHREGQKTNMSRVILLYLLGTFIDGCVAVITSFLFPVTLKLTEAQSQTASPGGIGEVLNTLLMNLVSNPVDALVNANYIGILAWAVLLGIALRKAGDGTKRALGELADAVSQVVRWIIGCAPFGVLGLVFNSISQLGIDSLASYGQLLLLLVGTMVFVALVVNPLIAFIFLHRNPYPLVLKCLWRSGLTAFFTRSSAANIPVNLKLCEELGLDEDTYAVSIPLGSTINMGGASITISILALAAAHMRAVRHQRLRRLRRGRRFPAAGPPSLQPVRHLQRRGHAGGGRGLYRGRRSGLLRDRHQLLHRRALHRCGGAVSAPPGTAEGLTAPSAPQFEKLPLRMAPEREFSLSKKSFQQADSTFQNDKPFWKVR